MKMKMMKLVKRIQNYRRSSCGENAAEGRKIGEKFFGGGEKHLIFGGEKVLIPQNPILKFNNFLGSLLGGGERSHSPIAALLFPHNPYINLMGIPQNIFLIRASGSSRSNPKPGGGGWRWRVLLFTTAATAIVVYCWDRFFVKPDQWTAPTSGVKVNSDAAGFRDELNQNNYILVSILRDHKGEVLVGAWKIIKNKVHPDEIIYQLCVTELNRKVRQLKLLTAAAKNKKKNIAFPKSEVDDAFTHICVLLEKLKDVDDSHCSKMINRIHMRTSDEEKHQILIELGSNFHERMVDLLFKKHLSHKTYMCTMWAEVEGIALSVDLIDRHYKDKNLLPEVKIECDNDRAVARVQKCLQGKGRDEYARTEYEFNILCKLKQKISKLNVAITQPMPTFVHRESNRFADHLAKVGKHVLKEKEDGFYEILDSKQIWKILTEYEEMEK